eukprot:SAG31_NODE_40990_length_278_cov_0.581006_1_plen_59_part_10
MGPYVDGIFYRGEGGSLGPIHSFGDVGWRRLLWASGGLFVLGRLLHLRGSSPDLSRPFS